MKTWKYVVEPTTKSEIEKAIKDEKWQAYRVRMKGLTTQEKLVRLELWYLRGIESRRVKVQVDNYINALLRGGQLVRVGQRIVVQR